ncbi:MAG: dihydroorotase [Alloprevotella sp.]
MHRRIHILNATIVNEGRSYEGSVVIDDGRIAEVLEGHDCTPELPADEVFDATGCYVLPGIIDDHVHFRDPGLTRKADFDTESKAAAAGGVTTVLDMPNCVPPTSTREALEEKISIAKAKSHVNYGFFFGATSSNAEEIHQLNKRLTVGIKLFMGNSTGNLRVENAEALNTVFQNSRLPIMVHCEDTDMVDEAMTEAREKYAGGEIPIAEHSRIRSAECCYRSTELAVRLAREHNARLHVAHISTARELELFTPGDTRITAEVCLPHLLFCDEDYARLGSRIKCNPSVKTRADRDALRKALNDGRIYCIGTDHAPHTIEDKRGGAGKAASGIPMVQFSLCAMLELTDQGVLSIERLVELMCHHPAERFCIENRGYIRPGYMADLVVVRPNNPWTLATRMVLSKCNWSPLEGHVFQWRVLRTYVNGYMLYHNGHITNENHHGMQITFTTDHYKRNDR